MNTPKNAYPFFQKGIAFFRSHSPIRPFSPIPEWLRREALWW